MVGIVTSLILCDQSASTRVARHAKSLRRGFTLIELLAVLAIVALLASILIPVISKVREASAQATGISNLRSLAVGGLLYAGDHDGFLPNTYFTAESNPMGTGSLRWYREIYPYVYTDGVEASSGAQLIDGTFRAPYLGGYEGNGNEWTTIAWSRMDFINVHMWRENVSSPWIKMNTRYLPDPPRAPFLLTGYNNGSSGLTTSVGFRRYCYHPDAGGAAPSESQLPKGTAWVYGDSLPVAYADGHVESVPYESGEDMYAVVFNQR